MKDTYTRTITDKHGREYTYVPTVIYNEFGIKSGQWNSHNCVLLILRKDREEYELINIEEIRGGVEPRNYFRHWNTLDDDGRSIHIDNQLGATHYAVIGVRDEFLLHSTMTAIADANESKFARMLREQHEEAKKD